MSLRQLPGLRLLDILKDSPAAVVRVQRHQLGALAPEPPDG